MYFLTPIAIIDKEEIEPLIKSSEEDDIRGGKPEFLQFMSERKNFLHDFVQRKLSTTMQKKIDNCTSRRSFLRKVKTEKIKSRKSFPFFPL